MWRFYVEYSHSDSRVPGENVVLYARFIPSYVLIINWFQEKLYFSPILLKLST